jgi:Type II/IV secretion system protein
MELQVTMHNSVLLRTSEATNMQRLLRATMRLRPDRIVVGEVRGGEALTLLKSWNTGHPGGIATIHANSAEGGLVRLSQLIYEAPEARNLALFAAGVAAVVLVLLGGTTWLRGGFWAPDGVSSRFVSPAIGLLCGMVVSGVLLTRSPATRAGW